MGIIANIIAGLVGSAIGQALLELGDQQLQEWLSFHH